MLPRYKAVVFVHGCFWHQHGGCRFAYQPKTNEEFWGPKLAGNAERDSRVEAQLENTGWKVFIMWECEIGTGSLSDLCDAIIALGSETSRPTLH